MLQLRQSFYCEKPIFQLYVTIVFLANEILTEGSQSESSDVVKLTGK